MYFYYFRVASGRTVAWKALVTRVQIVQFVFSGCCAAVTFGLVLRGRRCAGMRSAVLNGLFNASLLFGFIGVLRGNTARHINGNTNGHTVNGHTVNGHTNGKRQ
mgnify:CR=1 FL=1|jgi:hypothetical protein